jgi:chromatin remodeling complex protein RSC6
MNEATQQKRKPNSALAKPVQPEEILAAIVGSDPLPRTELTKKIWDYIKSKGLQDQTDKRKINADEQLKQVFDGKSQVNMFEMTKLINNHVK